MSNTQIVVLVLVIVAVLVAAVVGVMIYRRATLRRRFGPEYRRLADEMGPTAAERELRDRQRRHAELDIRPIDPVSRERYRAAWTDIQARFVDQPEQTVGAADALVTHLVAECGYPTTDYREQMAQLSVDHARTLEHYRIAHEIFRRHQRGQASTDQLREALVHYRELVADLLGADPVSRRGEVPPVGTPPR